MFKLRNPLVVAPAIFFCASLLPLSAGAFSILIDTTLAFCTVDVAAGPVAVAVGGYNFDGFDDSSACGDASRLEAYNLNVGGNLYSEVFLNNDGLITLGGGHSGATTDVTSALFGPAFAPLFRDADYVNPGEGRISWGGTSGPIGEGMLSINYEGPSSYFQVNIFDRAVATGVEGDFDLVYNYTNENDPVFFGPLAADIGFNNGAGQSYLLPGSGIPNAFDGDPSDCGMPGANPTAVACNNLSPIGNGQYIFEFRNGSVVNLPTANVPEPPLYGLMLLGLGLLSLRRR